MPVIMTVYYLYDDKNNMQMLSPKPEKASSDCCQTINLPDSGAQFTELIEWHGN